MRRRYLDADGWGIPQIGTRSHEIYMRMKRGYATEQIHLIIGGSRGALNVLAWKIRNAS